jgi:hypothetical protein
MEVMYKEAPEAGKFFNKGLVGEPESGLVYRGLRETSEGRPWKGSVSLLELCNGKLEVQLLFLGTLMYT